MKNFAGWFRNRFVWVAVTLLATLAGVLALTDSAGTEAKPLTVQEQILSRMRTTLEQQDPGQHNHAGHSAQQAATGTAEPAVVCGVRVYGYEPSQVTTLAEVRTVYGFHFCGVVEQNRPWDVAVKLAGPVIVDMATEPPGIRVVEATADVKYVDRLREMFPGKYADLALKEALPDSEMADVRRRYEAAAGL
jgi:Flp pilus assembly protein TadG